MLARVRAAEERDQGFTLVELLVVIIIIGILAAIAIPTFLKQREKGWEAAAQSQLRNAASAQEAFFTDNAKYVPAGGLSALEGQGYNKNPKVTLEVTVGAGTDYVMCAKHDAGGKKYVMRTSAGMGQGTPAQLADNTCPTA